MTTIPIAPIESVLAALAIPAAIGVGIVVTELAFRLRRGRRIRG